MATLAHDVRLTHHVILGVRNHDPMGVLPVVQWLETIPSEEGGMYCYGVYMVDQDISKRYEFYFEKQEMAFLAKMRWG